MSVRPWFVKLLYSDGPHKFVHKLVIWTSELTFKEEQCGEWHAGVHAKLDS